jgi:CheY-like chemotaxis protein
MIYCINDMLYDINYKKNLEFVNLNFIYDNNNIKIISDFLRLKRVLYNIISNSIKYTDNGIISISYDVDDSFITFKIADTGIGIYEDDIKYIFERFWQGDSSSKKKYKGNGLGLFISKKIINLLNGDIWLESKINKGTNFFIKLPLEKTEDKDDIIKNHNKINFSGKKALIVDELPIKFSLLNIYLTSFNIDIISSNNTKESIYKYKTNKDDIDIIFLDLNLDVNETLKLIKEYKKIKECVIISKSKKYKNVVDYIIDGQLNKNNLLKILNEIWQK